MGKTYIDMDVRYTKEGSLIPKELIWQDDRSFTIAKILDVRQAASLKAGGEGIRYTCIVAGKKVQLFFENTRWFIET